MSFVFGNRSLMDLDVDENALLDISDFNPHYNTVTVDHNSHQLIELMGKRKREQRVSTSHTSHSCQSSADIDDDSGFCGSNLSPNCNKMVRFDEELLLLKALMSEVKEPQLSNPKLSSTKAQNITYSSKSKNGKYELKILSQPEEQHRARYLTEGSRGAIKDKSGLSHPVVKVCGYDSCSLKIQCFIGHDKQIGSSHLFYQASKITGKNSTRCQTKKVDGTTVVVMEASPENDMQVTVDCVGILKERNVDVEFKLSRFKNRAETDGSVTIPSKKRSTRCRLVFRTQIPETNEILQVVSSPILCTQPLGTPEICKKSLSECEHIGGKELFIIGKNFLKDAKVIWKSANWSKAVEPILEFLHPTHLVCIIPCYDGPELKNQNSVDMSLTIKSGGKYSDAHKFTFTNFERVNTMTLINGTTAQLSGTTTSDQFLVSNFDKPIILTMVGSTAVANTIDSQMVTQNGLPSNLNAIQTNQLNALESNSVCYTSADSSPECVLSIVNEDSQMSSNLLLNSTSLQNESQMSETFNPTNDMIFDKRAQESEESSVIDNSIDAKNFKTESFESLSSNPTVLMSESVSQYLTQPPLNSFAAISPIPMTVVSTIPVISSINCNNMSNILEPIPSSHMTTTPIPMSVMCSEPTQLSLVESMCSMSAPIESKVNSCQQSIGMKSMISENPVLTSTASTTPTTPATQATNILALSEMSDAELEIFINPKYFDQI